MDLNTVNDYRWIKSSLITAGVPINGTIAPREDVYGQQLALRREDFAFLYEGISERRRAAAGYGGARNLSRSYLRTAMAYIAGMYAQHTGGGWSFVDPAYQWRRVISDTDKPIDRLVPPAMLREVDCNIPSDVSSFPKGDELRVCYYDLERCHRDFNANKKTDGRLQSGYEKTLDGTVALSSVEWYTTGGEGEEPVYHTYYGSYSHAISGLKNYSDTDGTQYTFDLDKGGRNKLLSNTIYCYENCWKYLEDEGYHVNRYETIYRSGYHCLAYSYETDSLNARLFLHFKVRDIHVIDVSTGTTTDKYVWVPCANTVSRGRIGSYGEVFSTTDLDSVSSMREIVSACFPEATFNLASPGEHEYQVFVPELILMSDHDWKSRINDLNWTWRP